MKKKRALQHFPASKKPVVNYYVPLFLIVLISFIVYLPVLHNSFVNWDDFRYIKDDPLIHTINLKNIFSSFFMGYQPLTLLVFAIEYHFCGLNETGFHAVNLLFHLLNVILVFRAVFLLSNKAEVALIASLLFGIHPMHVESVAWATELKDLLYVFFFLASYIFYLKYLNNKENKFYISCLLLFLFSLFSKGMATTLTAVLLLTDYFFGRFETGDLRFEKRWSWVYLTSHVSRLKSVWIEKIPFIMLSILFGILAILGQQQSGATSGLHFTYPQRIAFASYSYINYLIKLIMPLHLSAYYPYPVKIGDPVTLKYYAFLLLIFALAAIACYSLRFTKKIAFGLGFFTINILLVLQLFPFGGVIMADRFSYLASIGIFYLLGEAIVFLWNKKSTVRNLRIPAAILITAAVVFYSIKTYSQCGVWKNSFTLWNDVIRQDQTIPVAYNNRGSYLEKEKRYEDALSDLNRAIALEPDFADAYNTRGALWNDLVKYDEALSDLNKAITLSPDYADAFYNRGIVFNNLKRYEEAIADFTKAIALQPDYADAYVNRGSAWNNLKKYNKALNDYNKALQIEPDFAEALYNIAQTHLSMGIAYKDKKDTMNAIEQFNEAGEYNWKLADVNFYNFLGDNYHDLKNVAAADIYYDKALEIDPRNAAVLNDYSYFLSLRGENLDKAEAMSKLANELMPHQALYEDTYSWILSKEKKYPEAIESFKKTLNDGGDTIGIILEHYGDVLFKTGHAMQAIEYWSKAKTKEGTTDLLDRKIAEKNLVE